MNMNKFSFSLVALASVVAGAASAAVLERPAGFKIGQRLTLRPYVSFDYTFDSNGTQQNDAESESSWCINPHVDFEYRADRFSVDLSTFYGYRAYSESMRQENEHNYGERLSLKWTTAGSDSSKGWSILLAERFEKVNADDDLRNDNGLGLWRDRYSFQIEAAIQRRFNEKWHAAINGSYYWLDYANDGDAYMNLYGWQRLTGGAEVGYVASRWTDIILAGSYQSYFQDNSYDLSHYSDYYGTSGDYDRQSDGYTVHIGLQSQATEKISYRLMGGWSRYSYGDAATDDGFTYSASANWRISETWQTMLVAESYYMPSEREFGAANRVDMVSWGLSHSMIRGKLNAVLDIAYRRETRVQNDESTWDYDENIFSGRLGLDYTLNRFFAIFARGEYQGCLFGGDMGGVDRDYNRFRLSVGFRVQY